MTWLLAVLLLEKAIQHAVVTWALLEGRFDAILDAWRRRARGEHVPDHVERARRSLGIRLGV